ncbi:MAG: hypothetical protein LBF97_02930 [Elusimicrobiota bacterium]|jgi:hypothetical protein|nr:hypothetical protein [Elusimicrobiota bacterium]
MSVVNVFSFMFESEGAEKLKKDFQDIEKKIKDIVIQETKQDKTNQKTSQSMMNLSSNILRLTGAYFGLKQVLSQVIGFSQVGENWFFMGRETGLAIENLERLGIALENFGGNKASAGNVMANLQSQIQQLKFGTATQLYDAATMYGLNIDASNPEDLLKNIAKKMGELETSGEKLDLGRRLGLDMPTILLLQDGLGALNEELERASKLTIYTPEDIASIRKFQLNLRELKASIMQVWASISRDILPILNKIIDWGEKFFGYMKQHEGFILGFLGAIALAIGAIAIASLPITAPFLSLLAIATAIGLIIDDIVVYLKGGDSVLGDIVEWLKSIKNYFNEWLESSNKFKKIWEGIVAYFQFLFNLITKILNLYAKLGKFVWNTVGSKILGTDDTEEQKDIIKKDLSYFNSPITTLIPSNTLKLMKKSHETLEIADTNPLAAETANSIKNSYSNNKNSNVTIEKIEVNTKATDAKGIANDIGDGLSDKMEMLENRLTDEVIA